MYCSPAELCGTPTNGAQTETPSYLMKRLQNWYSINIYTEKMQIGKSHQVPNIPDHAKLLGGQPEGT